MQLGGRYGKWAMANSDEAESLRVTPKGEAEGCLSDQTLETGAEAVGTRGMQQTSEMSSRDL